MPCLEHQGREWGAVPGLWVQWVPPPTRHPHQRARELHGGPSSQITRCVLGSQGSAGGGMEGAGRCQGVPVWLIPQR